MITIKPHHFLDVIKLYGKGIERFVPDEKYNHDFYSVANDIMDNHQVLICVTLYNDHICGPCRYLDNGVCVDKIYHIEGISLKDEWNKVLDKRIMKYANVSENGNYTAHEFCKLLYSIKEHIFDIWKEENDTAIKSRYDDFCTGAKKFLGYS